LTTYGTPQKAIKPRNQVTFGSKKFCLNLLQERDDLLDDYAAPQAKSNYNQFEFVFPYRLQTNTGSFKRDSKSSTISSTINSSKTGRRTVNVKSTTKTKLPTKPAEKMKPDPDENLKLYYVPKEDNYNPDEDYPFKYYKENRFYPNIKEFISAEVFETREQSNIFVYSQSRPRCL
jgi:hypothetical protein